MLGGGEGGSAGSVGSAGSADSAGSWGVSRFSNAFSSTSTMVSILLTMASFSPLSSKNLYVVVRSSLDRVTYSPRLASTPVSINVCAMVGGTPLEMSRLGYSNSHFGIDVLNVVNFWCISFAFSFIDWMI